MHFGRGIGTYVRKRPDRSSQRAVTAQATAGTAAAPLRKSSALPSNVVEPRLDLYPAFAVCNHQRSCCPRCTCVYSSGRDNDLNLPTARGRVIRRARQLLANIALGRGGLGCGGGGSGTSDTALPTVVGARCTRRPALPATPSSEQYSVCFRWVLPPLIGFPHTTHAVLSSVPLSAYLKTFASPVCGFLILWQKGSSSAAFCRIEGVSRG